VAFHDSVLDEILEERVVSSRGKRNPRGVKRRVSCWPSIKKCGGKPSNIRLLPAVKVLK
jgi:hypothetical protein